jgi:hypothetical protein
MSDYPSDVWQPRLIATLAWLLALSSVAGAVIKFLRSESFFGPPYSEKFVD